MKSKITQCAKERTALLFLIQQRIEAKGVTVEQASLNMDRHRSYFDAMKNHGNPTIATILMIEKELGIEIFKWDKEIPNKDKPLKKVFVEHGNTKK